MNMTLVSILTIFFYAAAVVVQLLGVNGKLREPKWWLFGMGLVAVSLHAVVLHAWIDVSTGQNLTVSNMLSLIIWLVAVLILVVAMFRRIEILVTITFPLAIFSILFVLLFPQEFVIQTLHHPKTLFHVLLAVCTFSVLCFAGLLAILLAVQERLLRKKRFPVILQKLPPLEAMEELLFQTILLGFILLSGVTLSSLYFYLSLVVEEVSVLQKAILVVCAWWVFAILLMGRYYWGWRGRKAIYGTLTGVGLLLVAYCVSYLVWL